MSQEDVFIVDVGSSSVKSGLSGEDTPSFVFPAIINELGNSNQEVKLPFF